MEAEYAAEKGLKTKTSSPSPNTTTAVRHMSNASDVETELKVGAATAKVAEAATDEATSAATAKAASESRRAEPSRAEAIRNARAGDQIKGYTKAAENAEAAKEARVSATATQDPVGIHGEPLEEGFGYGALPTKSAVTQAGDELLPATTLKKQASKAAATAAAAEAPSTADVAKMAVAADAAAGATAEVPQPSPSPSP